MSFTGKYDSMRSNETHWFVMRDLTRCNAKMPAYQILDDMGIENFTPKVPKITIHSGKRECKEVPFIHDLIFVHDTRMVIDTIVEKVRTFQYRFLKGREPMTVKDKDMEKFKKAVESSNKPQYYRPQDITPDMRKRKIRIIGSLLDGCEGYLLTVRGSKQKRLLIELPSLLAAAVEVEPEYIQLL